MPYVEKIDWVIKLMLNLNLRDNMPLHQNYNFFDM